MSAAETDSKAGKGDKKPEKQESGPKKPLPLPLVLTLVNTLTVLGALGMLIFTKVLFKRPPITESAEREKVAKNAKRREEAHTQPGLIPFEPVTINLTGPDEKLHYATVSFSLEIKDVNKKDEVEGFRPIIQDELLNLIGRQPLQELNSVQGRYVIRAQMVEAVNRLMKQQLVTNIFFSDFSIQ